MLKKKVHPGVLLSKMLLDSKMTQREFAAKINIPYPIINNILKGSRNINVRIALSLEAANFESADFWLSKQIEYSLSIERKKHSMVEKQKSIKEWEELSKLVPISYFRKDEDLEFQSSDDINKIFDVYNVNSITELKSIVKSFNPVFFRKSSKFLQDRNNIVAWSIFAEHKVKNQEVNRFDRTREKDLILELKNCFLSNVDVIDNTKAILNEYGIKFLILDRPSKTPVDGKSFISGNNPAIVLSLKYKRLDNFVFTLFHEIGHVFCHLTNPEYKKGINEFYVNNSDQQYEEHEANTYAQNHLIENSLWDDFILFNNEFTDDMIRNFAEKVKVHPAIVRGRVCFEFPEYYRKRSSINSENRIY